MDSRAVSIAVPIVVVLVLVALVTSMVAIGIGYFNLQKVSNLNSNLGYYQGMCVAEEEG